MRLPIKESINNIIWIVIFPILSNVCQAQSTQNTDYYFDGLYTGLHGGSQNVFGGSYVNNMDILAQESRFVLEMVAGYRKQFIKGRLFAGIEFQYGFLNANLNYYDPAEPLQISYESKTQHGLGLTVGTTMGSKKRLATFVYLNETKRKFEVTIVEGTQKYFQTDKQGMLKYGLGIEYRVYKKINVKCMFGAMRVDFGDLKTNIDVEDKYDFVTGIIYQL